MSIAVWIVSGLLAAAYLFSGSNKLFRPRDALKPIMPFVESLTPWQVKAIGALEILGAVGLIVPVLTGVLVPSLAGVAILTPIAAVCLALLQIGAFALHVKRGEAKSGAVVNGLLFAAAVFIAVTRLLGF
jgi:uncharacterized membrane protein